MCTCCPGGQYAPSTGSSSCLNCGAGQFSSSCSTGCTSCPVGTFATGPGWSSCSSCAAGSFTSTTGKASCTLCPTGQSNGSVSTEYGSDRLSYGTICKLPTKYRMYGLSSWFLHQYSGHNHLYAVSCWHLPKCCWSTVV